MCLYIKNKKSVKEVKPQIAKKDIICYKLLDIRGKNLAKDVCFVTPYMEKKMKLGKQYSDSKKVQKWTSKNNIAVGQGVFHTYTNKMDAFVMCQTLGGCIVVKCIIPKGTEYYKGVSIITKKNGLFEIDSYASKSLFVTEEIEWIDSYFLKLAKESVTEEKRIEWEQMLQVLKKKYGFDAQKQFNKYSYRVINKMKKTA